MNKLEIKMKKEYKIKKVYEGYKGMVDENGWTDYLAIEFFGFENLETRVVPKKPMQYRPKSLSGIETNNGWIEIDHYQAELPIEIGKLYHFIPCWKFEERFIGFFNDKNNEVYFFDKDCFDFIKTPSTQKNFVQLNSWLREQITHYQEIVETKQNLY